MSSGSNKNNNQLGKMIFQERDAEILQWINGFGFASVEQIKGFMQVGDTAAYVFSPIV